MQALRAERRRRHASAELEQRGKLRPTLRRIAPQPPEPPQRAGQAQAFPIPITIVAEPPQRGPNIVVLAIESVQLSHLTVA